MSDTIYIVEIDGRDPDGGLGTLRFATAGYNHPTAPGYYEPRIDRETVFGLRRDLIAPGRTAGASRTGAGPLILANADGGIDWMLGWAIDGYPLRLLAGTEATEYGDLVLLASATAEELSADDRRITVRLRDAMALLGAPIASAVYAGDNILPDGLEGTEDDLAGRPVPLCFGRVLNAPIPAVNTSRHIYQLHAAAAGVTAVYDRGVALAAGDAYASLASLHADAPDPGEYRVWSDAAGSYVRLGSTPAGEVTADVVEGATAADRTAAQVAERILGWTGAIPDGFAPADLAALDAANDAEVGIWIDGEGTTVQAALDQVLGSVGAGYWCDPLGTWRMMRIDAPSGASARTLRELGGDVSAAGDCDIVAIERAIPPAEDRLPAHRITLRWGRYWATQAADLDAAIDQARRAALRQEWRTVTVDDGSVKERHRLSRPRAVETLLVDHDAAAAEAARLLALHGVARDLYRVRVPLDATAGLDLGAVITLRHHRFGLSAGRLMTVLAIDIDAGAGTASLDVWG
ncbi:MAG: hypothetical protein OHK0024_21320 [Thalassobaculales bacterium]